MREPNDYASEHLRDQLIHDPRLHEQDLTVRVEENRVTVGGRVSTPERHRAVTEVVQELMPGREISNETMVVSQEEPDPDHSEKVS